jgi:hypothetical protein
MNEIKPDRTTIKFTINTDRERFANWLQNNATRRFFQRPIENEDGSSIVLQPMSKRQVKHVTVCSFEAVYEPAGENRVAKLMGVLFYFELMPETHPNKFEVKATIKQKSAMSVWAELIVAIALAYPESEKTIKRHFGIDIPEKPTQPTSFASWDPLTNPPEVPENVVDLWREIKETNPTFQEVVYLSNLGYTQGFISDRLNINVQSVKNNLGKMRAKYNIAGKEVVLTAETRKNLGIRRMKE